MKKIVLAPYIDQTERWVNGCESISAVMALGAVGVPVDPDTFIARDLPHAPFWEQDGVLWGPDPLYVYPGDPHDHTGYGCYAPCICQAMRSALEAEGAGDAFEVVDETGRTAAELCTAYIDRGLPVVFWATLDFQPVPGCDHWTLPNGRPFDWKLNEHCLLLVGYDDQHYWFTSTTGSTTPGTTTGCAPSPRPWWKNATAPRGCMRWPCGGNKGNKKAALLGQSTAFCVF